MATESKDKNIISIKPRLTEKAALSSETRGVYAFNVPKDATKKGIALAIKTQYKVTPEKINMLSVPRGVKKAYVYLKKGDKITIA